MKSKNIRIYVLYPVIILILLALIYVGLMMFAYAFPKGNIQENREIANTILTEEGDYPSYFYGEVGATLDNYTDKVMISSTQKIDEMSLIFNALSVKGYTRYWHGYLVILRPLLSLTNIYTIRKIASIIQILLFTITLLLIHKRFSYKVSIPFAGTWLAFYSFAVTSSFQYFTCYFWMYLAMIWILTRYKKDTKLHHVIYFFLVLGSLVNFFDFLTFPLVTLSMPLIVLCLIDLYERNEKGINCFKKTILFSVAWVLGYGITWCSKWVIAKFVMHSKVIEDAKKQASYRMFGNSDYKIDRLHVIRYNIDVPMFLSIFLWIAIALIALMIILMLIQKKGKAFLKTWPLWIVAVMPYVWYEVLCNHSLQHRFFVYRAQMGTLFVALILLGRIRDEK